jgi:hypothetical protein
MTIYIEFYAQNYEDAICLMIYRPFSLGQLLHLKIIYLLILVFSKAQYLMQRQTLFIILVASFKILAVFSFITMILQVLSHLTLQLAYGVYKI